MNTKTCLDCRYYVMAGGPETGRTSFDFCQKKQKSLPTAAFCFEDTCCATTSTYNTAAFSVFENIALKCEYFEKKQEGF